MGLSPTDGDTDFVPSDLSSIPGCQRQSRGGMFVSQVDEPVVFVSFKPLTSLGMRRLLFVVAILFHGC